MTKPARLQELIVIIMNVRGSIIPPSGFVTIAACIVLISGKLRILLPDMPPALQLPEGRQAEAELHEWNSDFSVSGSRFPLWALRAAGPLHLVQPVQRQRAFRILGMKINIPLPAPGQAIPKPGRPVHERDRQTRRSGADSCTIRRACSYSCQYYDLRLASSRKIHTICGITVDISLPPTLETQCLMQKQIEVYDCFGLSFSVSAL